MLFKILHGDESNISLDVTPFHEGWCYVTHSGYFYVDLNVGTTESPNNQRLKLNASNAETLTGMTLEQIQKSISWNNLLDRPFGYETEIETPLTEERTFTDWCRLTNATGTWSTLSKAHSDGCIVKVYYDDEVYLCTAETGGSGFILVSDTELPFIATEAVAGSDGSVKFTALDGGTHTVLLTRVDSTTVKVPEEYLPEKVVEVSNLIYIGDTEPTDERVKIWINTSEDGTGVIPLLPRIATVTLLASAWTGSSNPWSQVVTIDSVGVNRNLDLQPTAQQIVSLQNEEVSLMISNENGTVTAWAVGNKPSIDYTMQVLMTEVSYV